MTELQMALQSQAIQKAFQQFSDTVTAAIGEALREITQSGPDSVPVWPQAGDKVWTLNALWEPVSDPYIGEKSWMSYALRAGNLFRTKADCEGAGTAIRRMLTGYKPQLGEVYAFPCRPQYNSRRWETTRNDGSTGIVLMVAGWAQPDTPEGRERAAQISREIWPGGVQS